MPKEDTQFKPGQSGNPKGRPKGSRNKLSEAFMKALSDDFDEHGVEVLTQVRTEKPEAYLQTVARLMPKLMELSGPDGGEIPMSGTVKFVD